MLLLAALCLAQVSANGTTPPPAPKLVAYWSADGTYADTAGGLTGKPMGGTSFVTGPPGISKHAFGFDGCTGSVYIPDSPRFYFTKGLTVSCWVYANTKAMNGNSPQSPIVFRGDDRDGLDPFVLALTSDGNWAFGMNDAANNTEAVSSPAQLDCWNHLCATWDAKTGVMNLFVNGELTATTKYDLKPITELDRHWHPGLGIGNLQNPYGDRHYQPFNGAIAQVKIYDGALAKPDMARPK